MSWCGSLCSWTKRECRFSIHFRVYLRGGYCLKTTNRRVRQRRQRTEGCLTTSFPCLKGLQVRDVVVAWKDRDAEQVWSVSSPPQGFTCLVALQFEIKNGFSGSFSLDVHHTSYIHNMIIATAGRWTSAVFNHHCDLPGLFFSVAKQSLQLKMIITLIHLPTLGFFF